MEFHANEVAAILTQLLPGFLTAWIFYSLTAHSKPSPFERVVQALIFTMIVQALVVIVRYLLTLAGKLIKIGEWDNDANLIWSVIIACVLGLVVSHLTNNDGLHQLLRKRGWTLRTSAPSEWYYAFSNPRRWVILNLSGERRLLGWPEQWPDRADHGHFIIQQPEWLLPDGSAAPLPWLERLLVPGSEVEFVEFLRDRGEVTETEELKNIRKLLISAQSKTSIS